MRRHGFLVLCTLLLAGASSAGCDLTRFTANSTANMFVRAGGAVERHWDPELVGAGLPGSILQLEGVYSVIPDNQALGVQLMRAYVSYGFGFVEDAAEEAEASGDIEEQERLQRRVRLLYLRARNIGLHLMRLRDPGIDDALSSGPQALEAYLDSQYTNAEDVALLFWVGYAWGSAINVSRDDPEMILDLATARLFVERAVDLDPTYFHYAGVIFLGVVNSAMPEALGGNPTAGREFFERALTGTERHFFSVQLNYAKAYAVATGDRALFISLLREVIDGGDPDPSSRLANRLARRRAIRLLRRVDELF